MDDILPPLHTARQQQRKAQTCFGLAEEMLSQLEKGKYATQPCDKKSKGKKITSEFIVDGIAIHEGRRGVEKINTASAITLYAINEELHKSGKHLDAGYQALGDRKNGGDVGFWIEAFDPQKVNFKAARETIQKLKDLFKETKDPTVGFPEIPKRTDGAYWMGPFRDEMPGNIMNLITQFHDLTFPIPRELNANDGRGSYYLDFNRDEITAILQKEGLLTKKLGNA